MANSVARADPVPPEGGDRLPSDPGRRRAFGTLPAIVAASIGALGIAAPGGSTHAADPRTLLVVGDSLSAEYGLPRGTGWVALLERRIAERKLPWRVVNASISGETTSGGRARLPDLLSRHVPALVVLELGGNDALRGLPLAGTESNLREMVLATRRAGARAVVFGMQMPPNYGRAYADQFAGLFRRVSDSEKVPLLPFFLAPIADRIDAFQPDRIHPTEQAQPLLLEAAWPVLAPLLGAR
jgi:acyl-CoA thioesterase-1